MSYGIYSEAIIECPSCEYCQMVATRLSNTGSDDFGFFTCDYTTTDKIINIYIYDDHWDPYEYFSELSTQFPEVEISSICSGDDFGDYYECFAKNGKAAIVFPQLPDFDFESFTVRK